MGPRIIGWGKAVPARGLTNADMERMVETTSEWIVERTGIRKRYWAGPDESASVLGAEAARMAIKRAGISPEDIDLIILATMTPDKTSPATASIVQRKIGAKRAATFDLQAACPGFVYGLATAYNFIKSGAFRTILVIGSEILSRVIDQTDRRVCVLFGDGAGAVIVQASPEAKDGPFNFVLGCDSDHADVLFVRGPFDVAEQAGPPGEYFTVMQGPEVFKNAVRVMAKAGQELMGKMNWTLSDVQLVIPHQANKRILDATGRALGAPPEKVYCNIERYGNTSSATIPIAICDAVDEGRLKPGDNVLFLAFGAGLTYAAMGIRWNPPPAPSST
ncbi:MAG: beta-ketoacyl-ACP synthase III [Dehalococcoidia bacterium]|nr:beta-ketoacyl-ACP synthase III [Dehalococcoidia bacterium]